MPLTIGMWETKKKKKSHIQMLIEKKKKLRDSKKFHSVESDKTLVFYFEEISFFFLCIKPQNYNK